MGNSGPGDLSRILGPETRWGALSINGFINRLLMMAGARAPQPKLLKSLGIVKQSKKGVLKTEYGGGEFCRGAV